MVTADEFAHQISSAPADRVLDLLESALISQRDFHRLFDARLIRVRQRLGLRITQPTSLNGIPSEQEAAFREAYAEAAAQVGQHFLDCGMLTDAWAYFRTIQRPAPVRAAIERRIAELDGSPGPELDELLNLALYEGAHTVEGIRLLLRTHGTCNTVTAMSQVIGQMAPEERRLAAAIMVAHLYRDLQSSVNRDVERREPELKAGQSLRELIAGREFLFADGNYHIDVSHLHSIVGFARHLHREDPELRQAIEMSLYGQQLSEHLRYPADVPFDDYYRASEYFLKAVAGEDVDSALGWFQERLEQEPDDTDKRMIAFVMIDLAQRVGRLSQTLDVAAPWLSRMEDPNGFSFSAVCVEAGRLDLLEQAGRTNSDLLALATVQLLKSRL